MKQLKLRVCCTERNHSFKSFIFAICVVRVAFSEVENLQFRLSREKDEQKVAVFSKREVFRCAECRSEEHTSELQSLMRISYAVFCLKKKKHTHNQIQYQ